MTAENVWGIRLLERKTAEADYGYRFDAHGDIIALTDEHGTMLEDYSYDPYGVDLRNEATDIRNWKSDSLSLDNPFRYCGEYLDLETNTYYLRARNYDPTIGRFLNEDTITGKATDPMSLNLYTYCKSNPISFTDPSGHMAVWLLRKISGEYNDGGFSDPMLAALTICANGRGVWTAFHEIAQINIAKELDKLGYSPILEQSITSTTQTNIFGNPKRYEADIVADGMVWAVKPILGKDPKKQLELYKTEGNLELGFKLEPIKNIYVTDEIKTMIIFPKPGEARYFFYKIDD